ncbi:MAG: YlxR family protein [Clostridiales bacterium]|nr:YlxR family protein [Clostridiales bacterium]
MKHTPLRSCIVCREQKAKNELVRIVRQSGGAIAVDVTGRMDGRGAYVCRNDKCITELIKKRALNRVFKTQVDAEVYTALQEDLKKLCDEHE